MTTPLFTGAAGACRALAALHPDAVPDGRDGRDRPVPYASPASRAGARAFALAAARRATLAASLAAVAATGAWLLLPPSA